MEKLASKIKTAKTPEIDNIRPEIYKISWKRKKEIPTQNYLKYMENKKITGTER